MGLANIYLTRYDLILIGDQGIYIDSKENYRIIIKVFFLQGAFGVHLFHYSALQRFETCLRYIICLSKQHVFFFLHNHGLMWMSSGQQKSLLMFTVGACVKTFIRLETYCTSAAVF